MRAARSWICSRASASEPSSGAAIVQIDVASASNPPHRRREPETERHAGCSPIGSDSAAGLTTVVRHASGQGRSNLTQATQVDAPHVVSDSRRNLSSEFTGAHTQLGRTASTPKAVPSVRGAWAGIAERGSFGALRVIRWIYARVGRGPVMPLLTPIVAYFFVTGRAARRASMDYLRTLWATPRRARGPRRAAHLAPRLPAPSRVRGERRRSHDRVERRRGAHRHRPPGDRAPARARARSAAAASCSALTSGATTCCA